MLFIIKCDFFYENVIFFVIPQIKHINLSVRGCDHSHVSNFLHLQKNAQLHFLTHSLSSTAESRTTQLGRVLGFLLKLFSLN
jgi:hypothetical protein